MKILFLASGSGGHVYPCLAVIDHLLDSHQIGYIIVKGGFEDKIFLDSRIQKYYIDVKNQASYYISNPFKIFKLLKEIIKIKKQVQEYEAIVCFGGFVSFIGALLSKLIHKPLYLHEQNYLLVDGNKFALKYARKIFLSYPSTKIIQKYQTKSIFSGNPRSEIASQYRKPAISKFKILFFAGSLGSSTLLNIIKDCVLSLSSYQDIYFTVITGKDYYINFSYLVRENVEIKRYDDNVLKTIASSSLVILRAGATSLSEVMAINVPSIIIPSPFVKHNHQEENARYYLDADAVIMIREKELTVELLKRQILELKNDRYKYYLLKENMKKCYRGHSLRTIIDEITK